MKQNKQKKLGIALGGGGACGLAHVGVLEVLERENIKISQITSTSMGAIVGALYAYGYTIEEIKTIAKRFIRYTTIVDFGFVVTWGKALFSGNKVERILRKYLKDAKIEDLKIPFKATAVDLVSGKLKVFDSGDLVSAVRCSMNVPGVFAPVVTDTEILIDGGMMNNVPHDLLDKDKVDFKLAIDVINIKNYSIEDMRGIREILAQSLSVSLKEQTRLKKRACNMMVEIDTKDIHSYDFSSKKALEAMRYGEEQMNEKVEKLKEKLFK